MRCYLLIQLIFIRKTVNILNLNYITQIFIKLLIIRNYFIYFLICKILLRLLLQLCIHVCTKRGQKILSLTNF